MNEGKLLYPLQEGVSSPKFIASADIHLGHKLYNLPDLEDDLRDNFLRLCNLALEKKVDYLVIAGDLFDTNLPKPNTISLVREQVNKLEKQGIRLVGIAGDHDKPVHGESWCRVSGVAPVTLCPQFAGIDYYDYSHGGTKGVLEALKFERDCDKVQWIFLHAQFPQLFERTEDKKKIEFSEIKIYETFPNLQGVIAGDIHAAPETMLAQDGNTAYLGYCGSLGAVDISEASTRSFLYCDGKGLYRIPFPHRRDYIKIDFTKKSFETFDMAALEKKYKEATYKPVFRITFDSDTEPFLSKIKGLYDLGHVPKPIQTFKTKDGEEIPISVRSEINNEDKIEAALKDCCKGDQQLFDLLSNSLTSVDPKIIFDEFKQKVFNE